jgi:hypothetical protein
MVRTWLLIDLRDNTCAVGLLKITEQGVAQWYSEKTLSIYVSPDTEDSRSVADLAFFRRGAERYWKPALRDVLEDSGLAECEKIPWLLRETPERLTDLLRVTLARMLGQSLKTYPNVPLLVLLDDAAPQSAVSDLFKAAKREATVRVIPSRSTSLAPFALWDANLSDIPADGAAWQCVVEAPVNGRDLPSAKHTPDLPERRRYVWRSCRFSVKKTPSDKGPNDGLPLWRSSEELERVGAAMYALFWRERLMKAFQTDAETLQRELATKQDLLNKLKGIYEQLTERGGLVRATGAGRKATT